jgi:hypothetical protein
MILIYIVCSSVFLKEMTVYDTDFHCNIFSLSRNAPVKAAYNYLTLLHLMTLRSLVLVIDIISFGY